MSALILLVLLLGGVWCLGSALLRLYRYLASRRVSPAAPRLWRDQRRRFLWSAALGVAYFAAFGVAAWWTGSGAPTVPPQRPGPLPQAEARGLVTAMPIPLPAAGVSRSQAPEILSEVPATTAPAGSVASPTPLVVEAGQGQAPGDKETTAGKAVEKTVGEPEEASGPKEGPANPSPVPQSETSPAPAQAAIAPSPDMPSQAAAGQAKERAPEGGAASPKPGESPREASATAEANETPAAGSTSQATKDSPTDKVSEGGEASPANGESREAASALATTGEAQGQAETTNTTPATTTTPPPAAPPQEAGAAKRAAWTVCAASFRRESMAQNYAQRLERQGLTARVSRADLGEKGVWYRVCLGGFASLAEAKRQYQAWEEQGLISDAFLLPLR